MKQVLQSLENGAVVLTETPCPAPDPATVTIRSAASVISSGTERMLLDFGRSSWIEKARRHPDKVKLVLEKAKTDGIGATIDSIRAKLDQPVALGYANAGTVLSVGAGVTEFRPGDRVVSNGAHAEVVIVSKNLCARIPDSVSDEAAAFTALGAIALQGVRLAQVALGECVVVSGLGLIGLIAVQVLRAHGCRVLGLDFNAERIRLAEQFGAETVNLGLGQDPLREAERFSRGRGVDAVLIAAASKSNEPVHQAASMCRKRGRIVLVGVTGLELSRDDFYKKELTFQVSCSYGPGRYDPGFESGQDYPYAFVRWTAQRNFEAILDMLAVGCLDFAPLVTHRFPFSDATAAYELIQSGQPHLGIVLEYAKEQERPATDLLARSVDFGCAPQPAKRNAVMACLGAGDYARKVLLPAFRASGAGLRIIVSKNGVNAAHAGRKFGFEVAASDPERAFADPQVDTIVIATRHDSHARYVMEGLRAGKHVFVEKPLALTEDQVAGIEQAYWAAVGNGLLPKLMVGFNRRFAPQALKMKALLAAVKSPKAVVITVNAGQVPKDHWTEDGQIGGGRLIGEACHFVDLLRFLIGAPARRFEKIQAGEGASSFSAVSFSIAYEDGSTGTVHYLACGHKGFPKERVEVFCAGRVLQLDNFRALRGWGWPAFRTQRLWRQDKGAQHMVAAFVNAIKQGKPAPIPFEEILEVSRLSLRIAASQPAVDQALC